MSDALHPVLRRALSRLDDRLRDEVHRVRESDRPAYDELRGAYVSDARIDHLLARPVGGAPSLRADDDIADSLLDLPAWASLTTRLSLTRFERGVLLLALAPEIDLKYETIYGYVNDDLTRKWPTRALALRTLVPQGEADDAYRHLLAAGAPLVRYGLLRDVGSSVEHPAWLAGGIALSPAVADVLVGGDEPGAYLPDALMYERRLVTWDALPVPHALRQALQRVPDVLASSRDEDGRALPPLVLLEGTAGSGQRRAAAALAHSMHVGMIRIDLGTLQRPIDQLTELLRSATLHQLLHGSVLYVHGFETLAADDARTFPTLGALLARTADEAFGPVVLACPPAHHAALAAGRRALTLSFDAPDRAARGRLWHEHTEVRDVALDPVVVGALADRFILTPGQIESAVRRAVDHATVSGEADQPERVRSALFEAARAQTRGSVTSLAVKTATTHTWDDLVLPDTTLRQVREVAAAIRHRAVVYDEWGFAGRLTHGRGLTALFSGSSGTGKTMAAAIIAKELEIDLYTVDLSSVVSKYIGETEKNLDRVFRAAHQSNAILFFDEADALFGKRSEVKDAHDRYANIEVAYLLQKMEEHEGAVILATNLSRNLDQAFARRLQYVVEFPMPGEPHRERLWRGMFPRHAPMGIDVDFPFLAKHFEIPGGDIRNVALDAAFLAAQNGRVITMQHLVHAMARQVRKQGRTPSATEFKHYFALLARE